MLRYTVYSRGLVYFRIQCPSFQIRIRNGTRKGSQQEDVETLPLAGEHILRVCEERFKAHDWVLVL